jgi:D-alanyl-lipoteichoic acid acyltransferase DltB (MBOAT superfamily)
MLFNSLAYAIFLPVVVASYFLLRQRARVPWLLLASCFFYMVYQPVYILVLATLIAIDYFAAQRIEAAPPGRGRLMYLWISIAATCAVLFIFKYFNFVTGSVSAGAALFGIKLAPRFLRMALPIGLSFHTFQSLAYVVEVYRGKQAAERNPLIYATYVMFFPQLVAGPIERPQHLLHQFREHHHFDPVRAAAGLKRIAWGLFKKAVIADRLALIVKDVFDEPEHFGGFYLAIAAVAFTYQIYCDFSGYTDMALGSAELLGFRLMENFDAPFRSRSIGEFWHRWHISLSTWFRDYVYIPLGGSRGSAFETARNLMLTFILSGLWHGAGWNYVLWGALNGAYLVAGRTTQAWRERLAASLGIPEDHPLRVAMGILFTFGFTCAAFVIFRATSLQQAHYILTHVYRNFRVHLHIATPHVDQMQFAIALVAVILLEVVQWVQRHPAAAARFAGAPAQIRWASYLTFASGILLFGVFLDGGAFIYFKF